MKNVNNVVKKTQNIINKNRSTWLPLYYSYKKDSVYTPPADGRFFVTTLINPNEADDIIEVVDRWKNM